MWVDPSHTRPGHLSQEHISQREPAVAFKWHYYTVVLSLNDCCWYGVISCHLVLVVTYASECFTSCDQKEFFLLWLFHPKHTAIVSPLDNR